MPDKYSNVQVVIMCKAPVEGHVKTRLMTRYSADHAMRLHMAMATTVIKRAQRLFTTVVLAVDDLHHPFFQRFHLPLYPQGDGDLGERMERMFGVLDVDQPYLFLGTDSPHMLDERLLTAARQLSRYDVVLGAVEDGGYDLIAMKAAYPALFVGIPWSSEYVLHETKKVVQQQSRTCHTLEISFDVDTPDMLDRAMALGWREER